MRARIFLISVSLLLLSMLACDGSGSFSVEGGKFTQWILRWNEIAIDASGFDHGVSGAHEQIGPTRASRAMAIVHIAMFDAVNGITPRYQSYLSHSIPAENTSIKAAVATAAHDTLSFLYPSQRASFDQLLAEDLAHIEDVSARDLGIAFGEEVAQSIIEARTNDGSELSNFINDSAYPFSDQAGRWRKDPMNPNQVPHGPSWYHVRPFVLDTAEQYRVAPPPAISSVEYAEAYGEVYRLGGDGLNTPTERTDFQTETGIFWAYDGTPSLCAPPRLYNQIARTIIDQQGIDDVLELARLLALVNVAMADAGIAIWEAKYFYDFWRPVTAIRESDPGTGFNGLGDSNPLTPGDVGFVPLGAPASNLGGNNFTPPFPSYPSGHAGFGGALFETLRGYFGTDDISFSFTSDEFNGETVDAQGNLRPVVTRHYRTLSEAEEENGQSRIYLGIHFSFDKTSGIELGRKVADHVLSHLFQPIS